MIPFTPHHNISHFLSILSPSKANNSNFPFLWRSQPPPPFSWYHLFLPRSMYLNGWQKFRRVIQAGSRWYLPLPPRLADALVGRRNKVRAPTTAPQTIWSALTTRMEHTVDRMTEGSASLLWVLCCEKIEIFNPFHYVDCWKRCVSHFKIFISPFKTASAPMTSRYIYNSSHPFHKQSLPTHSYS